MRIVGVIATVVFMCTVGGGNCGCFHKNPIIARIRGDCILGMLKPGNWCGRRTTLGV